MEKVLVYSHSLLKKYLIKDSVTIDATCGWGNDTLFLAPLSKKVYAFDVLEEAIEKTKELCKDFNNIEYILDGHQNVLNYVKEEVGGAIFNLGYLPKGSKEKTTLVSTTLKAVSDILKILQKDGIVVIVFYPGHPEGKRESIEVLEYLKKLDQHEFDVMKYEFINQINDPPFLVGIMRKV